MPTAVMPHAGEEITPEIADARQFEERLQRGVRDGSFLALLVNPKYYQQACQELCAASRSSLSISRDCSSTPYARSPIRPM